MNTVLSVYSRKAFKEFLLPAVNNADYQLVLDRSIFQLEKDVLLKLEIVDYQWKVHEDIHYKVRKEKEDKTGNLLSDGDVLILKTNDREKLFLIVEERESIFHSYHKFSMEDIDQICIGKQEENDIVYDYLNLVSRTHAVIERKNDGHVIVNQSPNGIYCNSIRVDEEKELQFGDYLNIMGLHLVYLGKILAIDCIGKKIGINEKKLIECQEKGMFYSQTPFTLKERGLYHRAPRAMEHLVEKRIRFASMDELFPNTKNEVAAGLSFRFPVLLSFLLGCMLLLYGGNQGKYSSFFPVLGLFFAAGATIFSIYWSIFLQYRNKKKVGWEREQDRKQYQIYLKKQMEEIKSAYDVNRKLLNKLYPETEECLGFHEENNRLWSRNPDHEDFLCHRLGIGECKVPIEIQMEDPQIEQELKEMGITWSEWEKKGILKEGPMVCNLEQYSLIGVIGGKEKKGAIRIAQILSTQMSANNCYTDLKMGFFYNGNKKEEEDGFSYVKWLPHVWSEDRNTRYVASNREEARDVFYELTKIFQERKEKKEEAERNTPYYVIFISEQAFLEEELFSKYINEEKLGLTIVLLCEHWEELPNHCEFILQNDEEFQGMYRIFDRKEERIPIVFDTLYQERLEYFARNLIKIRVPESEKGIRIPDKVSFFDLYGIQSPQELPVEEMWMKNRTIDRIRGILGQKGGGLPCYLDLHEKYHGPHGLIAGTTGSGKSELIKTLILSLAVQYSPEDVCFFIIDYKGGGMSHSFEGLPHLAGQISNLSGSQVKRALISMKSENKRRQKILSGLGINHIDDYTRLYKDGEVSVPMPHLLIVIDEFAQLKEEEPEFMKELISLAQIGRSLGMHLILATQKPGGTVDENIWSNSRFRLCLRVQNRQDSFEMLHKPDASRISQIGQCYLQVGNDEIYELFQSAYTGEIYDGKKDRDKETAVLLTLHGKTDLTGHQAEEAKIRWYQKKESGKEKTGIRRKQLTQLDVIKEYLKETAEKTGIGRQPGLWLPVLPEKLDWKEVNQCLLKEKKEKTGLLPVAVGMIDDPENQSQYPLVVDFAGHIAVCGGISSGKSTMLQTMIYGLIQTYSSNEIHIYGLDFGSGMMEAFSEAPQVGGIIWENEEEKIERLFGLLGKILKERKQGLKGSSFSQNKKAGNMDLPAVLFFIDNYAEFKEATEGRYEKDVVLLCKEGIRCGIYFVITGMGFSREEISRRIGENIETVLCLNFPDRYAYYELLQTGKIELFPEKEKKGRGLVKIGDRILEYQGALAVCAGHDYERMEKMKEICRGMKLKEGEKRAERIPMIPDSPVWSEFSQTEEFLRMTESKEYLPACFDSESAAVHGIFLPDTYCHLILGRHKTGKSNYLKNLLEAALQKTARVVLIDDEKGSFSVLNQKKGLQYIQGKKEIYDFFKDLLPEFQKRNQRKAKMVSEEEEKKKIFDRMSEFMPYFIFISDLSWFIPYVYREQQEIRGFLENIFEKGSLHHIYFFGELTLENRELVTGYPLYETFSGYRSGIHLGGKLEENPMLDLSELTFLERTRKEKTGIGYMMQVGQKDQLKKVVVPLAGGKHDINDTI